MPALTIDVSVGAFGDRGCHWTTSPGEAVRRLLFGGPVPRRQQYAVILRCMRTDSKPSRYVLYLLSAAVIMVTTGCGNGTNVTGASAPPQAPALQSAGDRTVTAGPPTTAPAQSGAASTDPTRAALATVNAYFEEIDRASLEGRVADVTATAMPGCQTCMLDIEATRTFHARGVHADVGPLAVGPVTMGPLGDKMITARMTVTIRAIHLLDAAGHTIESQPAQPPRAATATLSLTATGWRIENVLYSRGPS